MNRIIVLMMGMLVLPAFVNAAQLKMPVMFGDNMLLQRGMATPVWGKTAPGTTVEVDIAGQTKTAKADKTGNWMLKLDPLQPGGPLTMTVKSGNETLTFRNVLAGDVWICSGQSNMAMSVFRCNNAKDEIKSANYPEMRLFRVPRNADSAEPLTECKGRWVVCSPATVKYFSAVGFFYGRMLHKELKIPIGLISTNVGGTPVEAWMPLKALQADKDFKPILDRSEYDKPDFAEKMEKYKKEIKIYGAEYKEFRQKLAALKKEGKKPNPKELRRPRRPRQPYGPGNPRSFSVLYNGMIHPLVPYGIKGAIWY